MEGCGSKPTFTFLQSWLRQVTSSDNDPSLSTVAAPQSTVASSAASSKRRKGRPRKYVAAAGDRTLTGDALLVDTTSDGGPARCSVVPRPPSPPPPPPRPADDPPPTAASHGPTTSGRKTASVKRTKVGRRKDNAFQRGRRQPVKFIPAADKRPSTKPPRSSAAPVTSSQASVPVDGQVKRRRGRPRKHPAVPVFAPSRSVATTRKSVPHVTVPRDVESDSDDSDVIVTAYIAARDVMASARESTRGTPATHVAARDVTASARQSTRGTPVSSNGRKHIATTEVMTRGPITETSSVSQLLVSTEPTQPVKRKRGRPRKYPLPTNGIVTVNSSSASRSSAAAAQPTTTDRRAATDERRRVTRALTAAKIQHDWDTTRLASQSSDTPARNTPPLYYELSSSSDSEPPPSDVNRRPNNSRRKRKRRRSIPSRSLELSFSSIEKDDVTSCESACHPTTSGRSRDRESHRAAEMTSTPRYDRSTSAKDSTLRSRWINVEQRAVEVTTTAVVHRNADGQSASTTTGGTLQSNITRTAATRQCPRSAVVRRRGRPRRRPSDSGDPDWRRYPTKPSHKTSSHGELGQSGMSTTALTTPHGMDNDPPAYSDDELVVLVELQRRLASTSDSHVLRQVVDIIEASGRYQLEDATFDFDLCSLDRDTITKLRRCLAV